MTKAQAASVTSALILAGYLPLVTVLSNGTYTVDVSTIDNSKVDASTLATFAANQGVSAKVPTATLV